ncbi:MAG: hypothetical protein NC930_06615, partial [Candidatus Omnitrophica bacterium]|nr:hypothetical protein [Candidatus Omnitrophota bacterium]
VTPPTSALLSLEGTRETSSSRLVGDKAIAARNFNYIYRATGKGQGILSPAVVEYVHSDNPEHKRLVRSREYSVTIIAWPLRLFKKTILPAGTLLFTLAACGTIFFFFRKRRDLEHKRIKKLHELDPEKQLLKSFNEAYPYRVVGDLKQYYSSLKNSLFHYIREKYGVSFDEEPSGSEICRKGREKNISPALMDLCVSWYEQCEKVQFSGYQPTPDEIDKMVRQTERYFKTLVASGTSEEVIETRDSV